MKNKKRRQSNARKKSKNIVNIFSGQNWSLYFSSFKGLDKNYFHTVIIDFILVIAAGFVSWLTELFIFGLINNSPSMSEYFVTTMEGIGNIAYESAGHGAILGKAILAMFLFIIISIFLWGLTRYWLWSVLRKRKMSLKQSFKFTGMLFIWQIAFVLPLIIILFFATGLLGDSIFASEIAGITHLLIMFILFMVYLYLTSLFCYKAVEMPKLRTVSLVYKVGIMKIKLFIKPMLFVILTLFLLSIASIILNVLPAFLISTISIILWFFYIAWVRFYLAKVFDKAKI